MGNITKGSKTSPFLEPKKIEVYQFPVREERGVSMGRVPDDLIFPILNRFDQSRVHHSVAWDKRFNTVVGQHIHFWRPRVVITFETDVVLAGRSCSLGLMLTMKVFIPRSRYEGPLDEAHFKKCILEQEFIFHTGADAENEEVLEALQASLREILDNVAVRRMVFDVRNYPLPQQLQDTLAQSFAYDNAYYAALGIKVNCQRIDGMTKFFSSLPAHFFELNAHMHTFEEKMIRYDHIVMNINFGTDQEIVKRFIVYRINEWRQGLRKIKVYRIAGLVAHLSDVLPSHGWLLYICNCGREAVVYGKNGKYIRISHLGTNLIIHDSKMEYKPEKRHQGLPV